MQCLEIDKNFALVYHRMGISTVNKLGKIVGSKGDKEKELEYYNIAISLDANSLKAFMNRGMVQSKIGILFHN